MSDKDRFIISQKAHDLAVQLILADAAQAEFEDGYTLLSSYEGVMTTLAQSIFDSIVAVADAPLEDAKPARKAPAKKTVKKARPKPAARRNRGDEPEAEDWDELSAETQGALITAMQLLPDGADIDGSEDDETLWANCLYYAPDDWYDNRDDPKAPKGGPSFRHKQYKDNNDRGVGLWINGKAPVPDWVHTIVVYRDVGNVLEYAANGGEPF